MLVFLRILAALVLVGIIALLAIIFVPYQKTAPLQVLPASFEVAEGQGDYAMKASDCAACHTAPGGKQFAGGRAIDSPFGTIYSPNITPDSDSGIGEWSLDQFRAALYDGINASGHLMYPAMPYANYRKLSEEDVRALYHYFLKEVTPVASTPPETDLAFPFNLRWGIRAWQWAALEDPGFTPRFDDPVLDRGAYLVEGPGHCGACHTPRNATFAQSGYTSEDPAFLSGGEIDKWIAPDLRAPKSAPQSWSADELKAFLRNGRNAHTAVTGEMQLAVAESLQYLSDEDMDAIVAYLRHIGSEGPAAGTAPPSSAQVSATETMLASATPGEDLGARLYLDNCNACHFATGRGADGVFPELDGNSLVNSRLPEGLIQIILNGAELPSTSERPERLRMPSFSERLSDAEVAELASFVRTGWSNDAGAVTAEDVAKVRLDRAAD